MDPETIIAIFNVIFYVFVFLFGVTIGSFLNVCILRIPKGESLITNNSHCMSCNTEIKRYDLIPIISWCLLRGKCRACGAKISPRYTIVEAMTGIMFVICFAVFPYDTYGIYFAMLALFMSGLIVLAFQDLDTQEMCVSVLIYTGIMAVLTHILSLIRIDGSQLVTMPATLKECLIGMVSVSGVMLIIGFVITPVFYIIFISQDHKDLRRLSRALKNEKDAKESKKLTKKIEKVKTKIKNNGPVFGFGMGDIVVMAAGGLMLGIKATVFAAVIAVMTGAVYAVIRKATADEEDDSSNAFAFGPFLIIGLAIAAYVGNAAVDGYINTMIK